MRRRSTRVAWALLVVAAVLALVVRFRRSRGDERLQLKWFTFAWAALPVLVLGDLLPDALGNVLFAVGITFPPVAAGIAILRYRLYEIDSSELLAVVNQTVQPTSAALWLRPSSGPLGRPDPSATLRP
jgi:hypothetical protein